MLGSGNDTTARSRKEKEEEGEGEVCPAGTLFGRN